MTQLRKFYVSGKVTDFDLDLGRVVEARNVFMAAIQFHGGTTKLLKDDKRIVVEDVEEIKDDQ